MRDHYCAGGWVLGEQFGDGRLERIQFAGTLSPCRGCGRRLQVLGHRWAADVEMVGDLAQGPVFGPVQAMNGVDLVRSKHVPDARYSGKLVGLP